MTGPGDKKKSDCIEVDFMAPWFQEAAVSRAILDLLRKLTDSFQPMPEETTDMDWTAFKALARAGAADGIIRSTCTYADSDAPRTEYFHVRGDYPDAMPKRPFLKSEPIEIVLIRARLTATGVQWAEYLSAENTSSPDKVRGFVLQLLWQVEAAPGHAQRVTEPKEVSETTEAFECQANPAHIVESEQPKSEQPAETPHEQEIASDEDIEFGGPREDPYDPRVVRWFGKRLYLGPKGSQTRELFILLARKPGVSHTLGEVQRAVDSMETYRDDQGEDAFRKSMNRIAKALSKLRKQLRENDLDDHVVILKEGPREEPSYTLIARFGNS